MQRTRECDRLLRPALQTIGNGFTSPHQLPEQSGGPDMTEAAEKHPTEEESCNQSTSSLQAQHHRVLITGGCADLQVRVIYVVIHKSCTLDLYRRQRKKLSGHPLPVSNGRGEVCGEGWPHTSDSETKENKKMLRLLRPAQSEKLDTEGWESGTDPLKRHTVSLLGYKIREGDQ
jgi:hypothetical protein